MKAQEWHYRAMALIQQKSPEVREAFMYLVFGVLTTLVNLAVYQSAIWSGMAYGYANGLAFVLAVLFAYVTNKRLVFASHQQDLLSLAAEALKFAFARLGTFFMEMAGLWLFIDVLGFDELLPKYLMTAVVIVLNYFLSKWFVFKM